MAKKILIVDDEPDILMICEVRLKKSGYEVLTAEDGAVGLEKAKKESPDLIVLDIMLPKMDGFKVCALLKSDSRYSKIPIILFSAKAREEDKAIGKEVQADAYLTKPFEGQHFLKTIEGLIGAC